MAKYLDALIDPMFALEIGQQERILPTPHIDIQFPVRDRAIYAY